MSVILQALLLVIVWPGIVGWTAAGTFFVIKYQQQIIQELNTGFGSTICLSFINIVSSQAVSFSTDLEEWHPNVRTNVSDQPGVQACQQLLAKALCIAMSKLLCRTELMLARQSYQLSAAKE